MAGHAKDAYLALIARRDPQVRALLADGFVFVTNAFKAGAVPPSIKAQTDQEHVRRLRQEGYQVEMTTAYDEQGHPRPTLSAIWRKKREGTDGPLSTGGELSSLQRTDADSPP